MDPRTMTVWLFGIAAVALAAGFFAVATIENTKAKADASVAKAQEHTKRAEGRHQLNLMDALGFRR